MNYHKKITQIRREQEIESVNRIERRNSYQKKKMKYKRFQMDKGKFSNQKKEIFQLEKGKYSNQEMENIPIRERKIF